MTNATSPHEDLYDAAVRGLHEQTPSPRVFAIGDFVSGISAGKRWSGRIWNVEGERLSIEIHGGLLLVSSRDVTH